MEYKLIGRFIEILEELVDATREQTEEIKKFRLTFKTVDATQNKATRETKVKQKRDEVDWGSKEVDK